MNLFFKLTSQFRRPELRLLARFDNDGVTELEGRFASSSWTRLPEAQPIFLKLVDGLGDPLNRRFFSNIVARVTEELNDEVQVVEIVLELSDLYLGLRLFRNFKILLNDLPPALFDPLGNGVVFLGNVVATFNIRENPLHQVLETLRYRGR